jgi:hypothetical protein
MWRSVLEVVFPLLLSQWHGVMPSNIQQYRCEDLRSVIEIYLVCLFQALNNKPFYYIFCGNN